jgi:Predicted Zn-dependent hydrolases of the beta-lactamase fold
MQIKWLGHSCFLVQDSTGRKLLTDPYNNTIGYTLPKETVDVVTVSHQHFDHNYTENLPGSPEIIDKCGFFNICDIPLKGIPSYHDNLNGSKRGDNIIFTFKMDGFNICHLGDLGHELSDQDLDQIGSVDVLLIPVGGNYTLNNIEACATALAVNSSIVIPMHYKTAALQFSLEGVEEFVKLMKNADYINSNILEINERSSENNIVKILNYEQ